MCWKDAVGILQMVSHFQISFLDSAFFSLLYMSLAELCPSLWTFLAFTQVVVWATLLICGCLILTHGSWSLRKILSAAALFLAPILFASLTFGERSITSGIFLFATLLLIWLFWIFRGRAIPKTSIFFASFLLFLAAGMKQEIVPTAIFLAGVFFFLYRSPKIIFLAAALFVIWLGVDRNLNQNAPKDWRAIYLAANLAPHTAYFMTNDILPELTIGELFPFEDTYLLSKMVGTNEYGIPIFSFLRENIASENMGGVIRGLTKLALQHPYFFLKNRFHTALYRFHLKFPEIYKIELHTIGVTELRMLRDAGFALPIGGHGNLPLPWLFHFVQDFLSFPNLAVILSVLGIFLWRRAPGMSLLSVSLLAQSAICFLLVPGGFGFYWTAQVFWGTALPFLAFAEARSKNL